ncbi:UNVERIFIED_CONTAM: protein phosphatase 2C 70 [Sesamum radiatum]|uniref:Protein phosphatase 2C 70 n=1 Tax=Sesamum radiatum TaxID=300843 RepID=A0AAW2SM51_SESRA
MLEVISGASRGLQHSMQSTNTSKLPVTIGRVSPGDVILKDSEVSGKHAMINWNVNVSLARSYVILNGTFLNSQAVHLPQSGSRHWSNPVELSNGDVITLGTISKIQVHITAQAECKIPFGVGLASDPMALRRGGKKLPMEDVCYYQWPLPGIDQFGLFGICDGHGGVDAATSVSNDGFWDVINIKKAVQLVHQTMERTAADKENPAEKIANILLSEARTLRTKDNTSIIFLDFASSRIHSCKLDS